MNDPASHKPLHESILHNIQTALLDSPCDAFMVIGADNLRYVTQVQLPVTDEHPGLVCALFFKNASPCMVSPALWAQDWQRGSIPDVHVVKGRMTAKNTTEAVVKLLQQRGIATLGLDMTRSGQTPCEALGFCTLHDISNLLARLRQCKWPEEEHLLEKLAYMADHALLGATHHSLACDTRAEKGSAELIRIHALERGFEAMGYNAISQSATGTHACKYWTESPKFGIGQGKHLAKGEINRLELQATLSNYWAFGSRIMTMGWPTPAQSHAYAGLVAMREAAIKAIRPGVTCAHIRMVMAQAALEAKVDALEELSWGHGIGVCSQEAPYLVPEDETPLQEHMVLVLNPHVSGPEKEVLYARDTVLVHFNGCTILGWYKDWREPYIASDSYYSGGG